MGGAGNDLSTFLLGCCSYFSNNYSNNQIFQNILIQTFAITYKPSSYVMAEVKHIPSIVHAPSATLLQVRKFYEVNIFFQILLADFLMDKNLTFFSQKRTKIKKFSFMKSIKMHEKPHQNPMGF